MKWGGARLRRAAAEFEVSSFKFEAPDRPSNLNLETWDSHPAREDTRPTRTACLLRYRRYRRC